MPCIGITMRVDEARERRDALDQAWYGVLRRAGLTPVPIANDPEQDQARLVNDLGLAGLLFTGGNDLPGTPGAKNLAPERDATERALFQVAEDQGLPLLAVCRGMQHLVLHHGGSLRPVTDHVAREHGLRVEDPGPWPLTNREVVNSYHDFGIAAEDVGPTLRACGWAPDGTVEAVVHPDLPQVGILWHPERAPFDDRDVTLMRALFPNA